MIDDDRFELEDGLHAEIADLKAERDRAKGADALLATHIRNQQAELVALANDRDALRSEREVVQQQLDQAGIGRADNIALRVEELACQRDALRAERDAAITAARLQLDSINALQVERDDEARLREQLSALLDRTAIALKGPEPLRTKWSFHDVPDLAAAMKAERDQLDRQLVNARIEYRQVTADRDALRAKLSAIQQTQWSDPRTRESSTKDT